MHAMAGLDGVRNAQFGTEGQGSAWLGIGWPASKANIFSQMTCPQAQDLLRLQVSVHLPQVGLF